MPQNGRERLADYRRRARLKQYELADLVGLHETTLSQILSGRRRPGLDIAVRIEAVTGVPVESWSDTALGNSAHVAGKGRKTRSVGKAKSHAACS